MFVWCQLGHQRQVRDLHRGPPELEYDDKGRVVDHLSPLITELTAETWSEDEGKTGHHTQRTCGDIC
jgi:hypothetical protein